MSGNTTWQQVAIVRGGCALRLHSARGEQQLLRHVTLANHLGIPAWSSDAQCFVDAHLTADSLVFRDAANEYVLPLQCLQDAPKVQVYRNARIMTCQPEWGGLGMISDGALVVRGQHIAWVGPQSDLPSCGVDIRGIEVLDAQGCLVTPGLIDAHAHPLFAGNRADEFAQRARGCHYLDIAKAGGGIRATVEATRAATVQEHLALCCARVRRAQSWGTTTMEAKSGYDLRAEGELRLLKIAAMVDAVQPVGLSPTLLGAHVLPSEFENDRDGFVAHVCEQMIPQAAAQMLATAVDVYCDEGAFTLAETHKILACAKSTGLAVKAHVGQFADLGGAQLLATLGALSGDHLEQASEDGIAALAHAGVVATMLPGACVQLKMAPPPVEQLRDAGVKLALGSDLNPGTSHCESLAVPMWLATTHYGMTVEEAWLGVTRTAAQAIGRSDIGILAPGYRADFVLWDAEHPAEIPYRFGTNLVSQVYTSERTLPSATA